jgi:hypothetical protein
MLYIYHINLHLKLLIMENEVRKIYKIAEEIRKHWNPINKAALPYLEAMETLKTINDCYFMESAESIISYFLNNASTWKGEIARNIKKELTNIANTSAK